MIVRNRGTEWFMYFLQGTGNPIWEGPKIIELQRTITLLFSVIILKFVHGGFAIE